MIFIYFFAGLRLRGPGSEKGGERDGGGDCTFDLAVRREGLVLGLALREWVLVQLRGGWTADGWIGLGLAGLLGLCVCVCV